MRLGTPELLKLLARGLARDDNGKSEHIYLAEGVATLEQDRARAGEIERLDRLDELVGVAPTRRDLGNKPVDVELGRVNVRPPRLVVTGTRSEHCYAPRHSPHAASLSC